MTPPPPEQGKHHKLHLCGPPSKGAFVPPLGARGQAGAPVLSLKPSLPSQSLSSPPSLVPQASAAPVTDPQAGPAWALGSPGSGASGPAVAGEAMSVLGTNSCRPGSPPPTPEQVCPPAQPSPPRACPRDMGLVLIAQLGGRGPALGLAFRVLKLVAAEARPPVASLWARSP